MRPPRWRVVLAVVVTGIALSACASSFADADDPNVGIGDTDPETDTTHVTYDSDALNRSAFPEDAPQFFEAAIVGDEAYARNAPWPILDGVPLAGLASLVLPLEPELGVRVTANGDDQDRISSLVIEPVELGVDDVVHRVEARFEHNVDLGDLGIESAIDPPPDSLDG